MILCDSHDLHVLNTLNYVIARLFKFHLRQAETNLELFNTSNNKNQPKIKHKITRQMYFKFTGSFKDSDKSKIVYE